MDRLSTTGLNWQPTFAQVLSALVVSVCALRIVLQLANVPDRYSEFIVGEMTLYGGGKLTDIVIVPTLVVVFCVFFSFVQNVLRYDSIGDAENHSHVIATVLLWWSVPGVMAIGSFLSCNSPAYGLLWLSAGGIVLIVAYCLVDIRRTGACKAMFYSNAILVVLLLWLVPFTLTLLMGRLWMGH